MECTTVAILVLLLVSAGAGAKPDASNATASRPRGSGNLGLEFEGGSASVFSTWESASTHRMLQQTQTISVSRTTKRSAVCNSRLSSNCVGTASGKAARPCKPYNRCSRNSQ